MDARTRLVPSDFNGDKRTDVLMFREDKQKIAYYDVLGVDDVTYVEVMSADLTSWDVLGHGDFNDDGHADVAIQRTDKQKLAYYWFEEDGTPRYQQIINADLSTWNFLGIGDFNGDGRSDLLIQNGPQTTLAYYSILDEAPFIDYDRVVSANLSNYDIVGITDMDDNGKDDIVFWKNNKTNLFYYTDVDGSGNPLYTSIWAGPLLAWDIPAVGDFDGNGSGDLALLRTDQQKLAYYSILEDGSLDYTEIIQADLTAWNFLGAGDYDGDGRSDLLIQNALETTLAYYSPVDGGGVNYARILGADLTAWTIIP